jgi:inositol hexakisphosphate/diphosphoinositol-pentakisphosphate kinase
MDIKARSKPMREVLTRLVERSRGAIKVKVFGDKVILDEGGYGVAAILKQTLIVSIDVENWPRCDVLISFFSTDFPFDKAISYVKLRNPYCINDLPSQALLWDRRLIGAVLDYLNVPTPERVEVSRDGGPKVNNELRILMKKRLGLELGGFQVTPEVYLREDGDAIVIDGQVIEKPFVEKPVSSDDHNVYIYFKGGGGRRLFKKVRPHNMHLRHLILNVRSVTNPVMSIRLCAIQGQMARIYMKSSSTQITLRISKCMQSERSSLALRSVTLQL